MVPLRLMAHKLSVSTTSNIGAGFPVQCYFRPPSSEFCRLQFYGSAEVVMDKVLCTLSRPIHVNMSVCCTTY